MAIYGTIEGGSKWNDQQSILLFPTEKHISCQIFELILIKILAPVNLLLKAS